MQTCIIDPMLDLLTQNPVVFLLVTLVMVMSLSVHEFSHALAADRLGDPTARYLKRLTLNPKAHIDPIGGIFLLLFGFGWGRPVPINPINLKNPRRDSALIALAGPFSNLVIAAVLAVLLHILPFNQLLSFFLYQAVFLNLFFAFFNLLPFGPLDGFKIVAGFLPHQLAVQWEQMESLGLYILMFLVITHSTGKILSPLVGFSLQLLGLGAL